MQVRSLVNINIGIILSIFIRSTLSSTKGCIDLNTAKDLCTINNDTLVENDSSLNHKENTIHDVDEILETNHLSFEAEKNRAGKLEAE